MGQWVLSIPEPWMILGGMETLGTRVKQAMDTQRPPMTGRTLATELRKDPSYVSKLVNDQLKDTPAPEVLSALERVLGIPVTWSLRALGYLPEPPSESPGIAESSPPYDPNDPRAALMALMRELDDDAVDNLLNDAEWWIRHTRERVVVEDDDAIAAATGFYPDATKGPTEW